MDGTHFDNLTRLVGRGTTRRRVIAAALGMTAIAVDAGAASAARPTCREYGAGCTRGSQCCSAKCLTNRQLPRRQRNRCGCAVGYSRCDGACIDTSADNDNCGGCDIVCDTVNGETCFSGVCVCETGLTECDGVCVDTDTDEANCGVCDTACDTVNGETCLSGACVCGTGLTECDGVCVDTDADEANCGACDIACDVVNGEACEDGTCAITCSDVFEACSVDSDCCNPVIHLCKNAVCKFRTGVPCGPPDQSNLACEDNYCGAFVCAVN